MFTVEWRPPLQLWLMRLLSALYLEADLQTITL
jgi:hypothetical protein